MGGQGGTSVEGGKRRLKAEAHKEEGILNQKRGFGRIGASRGHRAKVNGGRGGKKAGRGIGQDRKGIPRGI